MKMYQTPNTFLLDTSDCMLAATQSAGETGQAAFAASCDFTNCNIVGQPGSNPDIGAFDISWQDSDNDASDVADYVVSVNINGTVYNLTDNDCNILFNTGTFTLSCTDISLGTNVCNFGSNNTLTVVSVEDPQGNVFLPPSEDCGFINEQGINPNPKDK